ncbi:MAG: hypothetical protein ACMUIG_05230 [Thermoplasmatota archaeon]
MGREYAALAAASIIIVILASVSIYIVLNIDDENPYELIETYSTNRFTFPENYTVDPKIDASIRLAGNYLISHMRSDGRWDYEYDPVNNESASGYNVLRHAGTTYSLALIFKYTRDLRYYNGTILTLNYLLHKYMDYEKVDGMEISYVRSGGRIKLGGAALSLLALTEIQKMDPEVNYMREIRGMGNFTLMMITETGKFDCYYKEDGDHNDYYPGEALIALSKLYDMTGDARYLEGLNRSWEFYVDFYGSGVYTPFTPWGVESLVYMHSVTNDTKYSNLALIMGHRATLGQLTEGFKGDPRYVGGFGNPPGSTTASKIEGVVDAFLLAGRMNDTYYTDLYSRHIRLAKDFLIRLQFNETDAGDYPDPERSVGGVPGSYQKTSVRIDYVQHTAVTLIKMMVYENSLEHI